VPDVLRGSVTWVPQGEPPAAAPAAVAEDRGSPAWRPWALLAAAVAGVGAAVVALRRRTPGRRS
jgi:hypothetical protein